MSRSHGTCFCPRVTNTSWIRCHVTNFCVSAAAPRACSAPALAPRRDGGTAACGCAIRRLLRLHRAPRHSRRRRCACSATRTPQHWLAHVLTEDMLSCPARRTRSRSRRSTRRTIFDRLGLAAARPCAQYAAGCSRSRQQQSRCVNAFARGGVLVSPRALPAADGGRRWLPVDSSGCLRRCCGVWACRGMLAASFVAL